MKIGMDIGTSTSSVCVDVDGEKHLIKCGTGSGATERYIPSAIYLKEDGTILIGQAAEQNKMRNPQHFVKGFKRELGQKIPLRLGEMDYKPEELITKLIVHLRECAEKSELASNENITEAMICHPANFSQHKKELLGKAAKNAGIEKVTLLDEPTAAAYYYHSKDKVQTGEKLLIYDLGGGTFDISLMERTDDGVKLLTRPLGIDKCGGDDFNFAIYQYLEQNEGEGLAQIKSSFSDENMLRIFESNIEESCIKAKELLSCDDKASIFLTFKNVELTREEFEGMIKEYVDETMDKVLEAIENAQLKPSDIDKILLVGGSCRIPYIKNRLIELVGDKVVEDVDPDLAVCMGAVCISSPDEITSKNEEELSKTPDGQYILGCAYFDGKRGKKQDYSMAVYWFKQAAEHDLVDAQYMLGLCYKNEFGVTKNATAAAKWFEKAAKNGHLDSQLIIGSFYQRGYGVKKNEDKSIKFYKKAQAQGSVEAQFELGNIYSHINYEAALEWYKKAAVQKYEGAEKMVAAMANAIAQQQKRDKEEAIRREREAIRLKAEQEQRAREQSKLEKLEKKYKWAPFRMVLMWIVVMPAFTLVGGVPVGAIFDYSDMAVAIGSVSGFVLFLILYLSYYIGWKRYKKR